MFTQKELEIALDALNSIKQHGPKDPMAGICNNITSKWLNGHTFVVKYATGWKDHSGYKDYPVPSSYPSLSPVDMHYIAWREHELWAKHTRYGDARWQLVDYLINRVTQELQELNGDTNA